MKYNFNQLEELAKSNSPQLNVGSVEEAFSFCEKLAKSHYENFPVGSLLIPKSVRKHFYSIYAFARLADDIADENLSVPTEDRLQVLNNLENSLDAKLTQTNTPILKAILSTVESTRVEISDLKRLVVAFKMDINFKQAEDFDDLYDYCYYSANPIGEMLLKLFGENSEENIKHSDQICTALQLVNFWQDISVDETKNRCFIPVTLLRKFGLYEGELDANPQRFQVCLDRLYQETEKLFAEGRKLPHLVKNMRLKLELKLIISSGIRILEKCKSLKTEIAKTRPALDKSDAVRILIKAIKI
jgi:squalene synthase HpnC